MRLQFDRFRGFVEEYSANLSLGGMFIRTDEPAPVGTEMPIEFRLGHDYELIKGRGRVVWARRQPVDDEHPAGMGLRFLELTPGSRELIFKLVERRVREGGDLFDLDHEADLLPERPPEPGPGPEPLVEAAAEAEEAAEPLPETSFDGLLETEGAGSAAAWTADPALRQAHGSGEGGDALRQVEAPAEGDPVPPEERGSGEDARDEEAAVDSGEASWPGGADDDPRWPVLELDDGFGMELGGGATPEPRADAADPAGAGPGDDAAEVASGPLAADSEPAVSPQHAVSPPSVPRAPDAAASDPPPADTAPADVAPAELSEPGFASSFDGGAEAGDRAGDAAGALRWQDPLDDEGELPAAFSAATDSLGEEGDRVAAADDEPPPLAVPPGAYAGAGYAGVANTSSPRRRLLLWLLPLAALVVLAAGWWLFAASRSGGASAASAGPRFLGEGEHAVDPSADEARPSRRPQERAPQGSSEVGDPGSAAPRRSAAAAGPSPGSTGPATGPSPGGTEPATGPSARSPEPAAGRGPSTRSPEPVEGRGSARDSAAAATAVREVTWSREDGRTVLRVRADGPLTTAAVSDFRIGGDAPRHVLRIRGITQPFTPARLEVGTAQVLQVRAGLHAERSPSELHLVLDLAGPDVEVASIEAVGGELRIVVEGGR